MEREIEYDLGNGQLIKQIIKEPETSQQKTNLERKKERALADIVCIFFSPTQPGIMFYDRTPHPASPESRLAGSFPEGWYLTDLTSISTTKWDKKIHVSNGEKKVRVKDGTVKITTIIVSPEEMKTIVNGIIKSTNPDCIIIKINPSIIRKIINGNSLNYRQENHDDFQSISSFEDGNGFDNTDTSVKKTK
jgi:hypothetical protein